MVSVSEKTRSVAFTTQSTKIRGENEVKNLISKFPSFSIRKAASAFGFSPTLVFNILHEDLHLKPYKFHQCHMLEAHDYEKGQFCQLVTFIVNGY